MTLGGLIMLVLTYDIAENVPTASGKKTDRPELKKCFPMSETTIKPDKD